MVFTVTCFFLHFTEKFLDLRQWHRAVSIMLVTNGGQIGLEWQSPSRLNSQWVTMPATIYQSSFVRSRSPIYLFISIPTEKKKKKTQQTRQTSWVWLNGSRTDISGIRLHSERKSSLILPPWFCIKIRTETVPQSGRVIKRINCMQNTNPKLS